MVGLFRADCNNYAVYPNLWPYLKLGGINVINRCLAKLSCLNHNHSCRDILVQCTYRLGLSKLLSVFYKEGYISKLYDWTYVRQYLSFCR